MSPRLKPRMPRTLVASGAKTGRCVDLLHEAARSSCGCEIARAVSTSGGGRRCGTGCTGWTGP